MDVSAAPAALPFDWSSKWLKGEEYAHMLHNVSLYTRDFGMQVYPSRTHPSTIYSLPSNGLVYFIQGKSVGSEFGFPRVEKKKNYRWKKMNFTTELPKRNPVVSYVVATAIKSVGKTSESPLFRMHAVVLTSATSEPHILCHIRGLAEEDTASSVKSDQDSVISQEPRKKQKKFAFSDCQNGLFTLLEAAKILETEENPQNACEKENTSERDYVSLYHCGTVRKFPLLGTWQKPMFEVVHR